MPRLDELGSKRVDWLKIRLLSAKIDLGSGKPGTAKLGRWNVNERQKAEERERTREVGSLSAVAIIHTMHPGRAQMPQNQWAFVL